MAESESERLMKKVLLGQAVLYRILNEMQKSGKGVHTSLSLKQAHDNLQQERDALSKEINAGGNIEFF